MRLTKEQQGAEDRLANAVRTLVDAYGGMEDGSIITDVAFVYGIRRFDDDGSTESAAGTHIAAGTPHYSALGLLRQGAIDIEHGYGEGDDED